MRKKIIAVILVAAMLGSLAACGTSKDNDKAAEATTEAYDDGYVDIDIDAEKYVELGEYKKLTIEGASADVTDEEVEERINEDLDNNTTYEKLDRKVVEDGDFINISYVCLVDGEEVEDFTETDLDIPLGDGSIEYLQDGNIEEQLVGAKVGETKKFSGTFSEELYSDNICGKKGEMEITINYIQKEVTPELTEDFAKDLGYESLEDYKKQTRESLESEAKSYADEENQYALLDKAVQNAKVIQDFPEDVIAAERSNVILDLTTQSYMYGLEIGETDEEISSFFEEEYGMTLEDYVKEDLKRICVVQLILKAEKVEVTEDDIKAYMQQYMSEDGYASEEEMLEDIDKEDIKSQLEYERLFEILSKDATITKAK